MFITGKVILQTSKRPAELQICRPCAYLPRTPLFWIQDKQAFISVLKIGYTMQGNTMHWSSFYLASFCSNNFIMVLNVSPVSGVIQQPQACSCIGRDLSVSRNGTIFFQKDVLSALPCFAEVGRFIKNTTTESEYFSGISWDSVLQGQVTSEFKVRKQLHTLICY